eukprot:6214270-Pleurochrysis_carterae.AAC.1
MRECCAVCLADKAGCSFFIHGVGVKAGSCWHEIGASENCTQGWEADEYNFYELLPPAPAPPGGAAPSPPRSPALFEPLRRGGVPQCLAKLSELPHSTTVVEATSA